MSSVIFKVRGILDIAAQCEEAGLTTPEETKSNAQYSTTVQQSQKQQQQKQQQQQAAESKKYAFMLDKNQPKKVQQRKTGANIIGSVDQHHSNINKVSAAQVVQQEEQHQVLQQSNNQHTQQETATATTLEELQQALASGQAIIQTSDPNGGGEQTLQMMEGQCVVTGSGQTYVVVQEGENLSFVPAEMVQGDLQAAVNGGQVMESLDNVEQQLAHMQGQVLTTADGQVLETAEGHEDSGNLDTMSVVESLVKLGQKQPNEGEEAPEVGPDMPDLGGVDEASVDDPDPIDEEDDKIPKQTKGVKRKAESVPGGRGRKMKN